MEKSKWNVALFHLEDSKNLWTTEKGYILFSFSEQRSEGYGGDIKKNAFERYKLSVAPKISPIWMGTVVFLFWTHVPLTSVCHKPRRFSWVVRHKKFKFQASKMDIQKGGMDRDMALRWQVVTQGNLTHSRTLKPVKQTGFFFSPLNQLSFFK